MQVVGPVLIMLFAFSLVHTCRRIGSKFRWMRSTPTDSVSTRLKLLVCLARTGVNAPANAEMTDDAGAFSDATPG